MNNNLQTNGNNPFEIFNYNNLGSVKTKIDKFGKPWFCLNDVCEILNIKNPSDVKNRLIGPCIDLIEVGVQTGLYADGITPIIQNVPMVFISEPGLYQAIGKSRKSEAQKFMYWVWYEVLPAIAENGRRSSGNDTTFRLNGKDYKPNLNGFVQWVGDTLENHENRIGFCENTLAQHGTQLQDNRAVTDDLSLSIGTMLHHSAVTIVGFINLYKLPIDPSAENLRNLGLQAKQLTESRGFTVGSIYDERRGKVNVYPVDILQELFSTIS